LYEGKPSLTQNIWGETSLSGSATTQKSESNLDRLESVLTLVRVQMVLRGEAQLELGPNCQHVGMRREGFTNPSFLLLAPNLLNYLPPVTST